MTGGNHTNFKWSDVELLKEPYASESTRVDPSGDRHVKQAKIGHGVTTQSVMAGLYQAEIVLATRVDTRSKYVLFLFFIGLEVLQSAGTLEVSSHLLD